MKVVTLTKLVMTIAAFMAITIVSASWAEAANMALPTKLSQLDVPLTIWDAAGVARQHEPCSTGVPLPMGLLQKPEGIAVFDNSGNAVPAQFRVLERWRDKGIGRDDLSIKWLLVTFLADVPKQGKSTYHLQAGNNPMPRVPVIVVDNGPGLQMGKLSFKKDFSLPFKLVFTDPTGKELTASNLPVKWSIWEPGPVRACIKAESPSVPGKFGFIAYIYSYAGLKRWDLSITLKNTPRKMQGPLYFKDFSVVWAPEGFEGAKDFLLGGDVGKSVTGKAPAYLYQDSDGSDEWDKVGKHNSFVQSWSKIAGLGQAAFRGYKVFSGNKELGSGNSGLGWAALSSNSSSALVSVRHFSHNYPKAVEVAPGKFIVHLWPKYWQAHTGLHWLDDCQRKTHDLSFTLTSAPVSPQAGEQCARRFNAPLLAHTPAWWYHHTAVQHFPSGGSEGAPDPEPWSRFEKRNWVTFGGDISDRIRRRYHQATMTNFCATSNPYSAYVLAAYMRHSSGMTPLWIDDHQYPRDTDMLTHKQYCGLGRNPGNYRDKTGHHGYMAWNHAHFLCQELFDGWRLFGDPLALESIKGVACYCQSYVDFREAGGGLVAGTRADGKPFYNLAEAYRITGDPSMRRCLDRLAAVCWKQVNKVRGNYGVMSSWEGGKANVEKPFMMGQVMEGLRAYYELTGDERTADQILGMTDFIRTESTLGPWGFAYVIFIDPKENEARRPEFKRERAAKKSVSYGPQIAKWMAWAHWYTGEQRFRQAVDGLNQETTRFAYTNYYPERTDKQPPEPVTNLTATALGAGKVKLTWSAPPGRPVRYQLKWSDKPMVERVKYPDEKDTHSNWWAANQATGEPAPATTGTRQSMVAAGISPGLCYFAIRSFNAERNRSKIGNVVEVLVK